MLNRFYFNAEETLKVNHLADMSAEQFHTDEMQLLEIYMVCLISFKYKIIFTSIQIGGYTASPRVTEMTIIKCCSLLLQVVSLFQWIEITQDVYMYVNTLPDDSMLLLFTSCIFQVVCKWNGVYRHGHFSLKQAEPVHPLKETTTSRYK